MNKTVQESAKGEPENIAVTEGQEIECRWMIISGSRLKSKVCATKSEWEQRDKKNVRNVDVYKREIDRASRSYAPVGIDPMGGQSGGMPR